MNYFDFFPNNFLKPYQASAVSPLLNASDIQIFGYVKNFPSYENTHVSFDFLSESLGLLHLTWYGPRPLIQPGTGWSLWVKLKATGEDSSHQDLKKNINNNFNYQKYLKDRGYLGYGSVEAGDDSKPWVRRADLDHAEPVENLRFQLHRKILKAANEAGVGSASGLLLALSIGDKSLLTQAMWKILQDTGTSHLVAISGLHIGLIALLFYGIVRRVWALSFHLSHRLASQKAAAIAGFVAGLGYSMISGWGIPAERTMIMLGMAALYQFLGKTGGSFKGWCMAFCICLALQPWAMFSISFWLSFLAVFSLIYLLSHRIRAPQGILSHLKFQFALYWLLIPATLYSFGVVSTGAYLVNLWAIPLVSFWVVPILFFGILSMLIPGAGFLTTWCFYLGGKGALLWWWGLAFFSHLPYAGIYLHTPPLGEVIAAQIGIFWAFAPKAFPGKYLGILWMIPMLSSAIFGLTLNIFAIAHANS
jgi:competence protein ComEC